ncbi:DUF2165 family protein [Candidatus Coxiella mudrowiae]|uniref:DUF2165 family protein n=1 Tax=Candidatus Coxiella mudrowiae TaxID=2054173 RepID=UPI0012FED632|nr:DUF2165 family protein [Candidatus Coxiella mudrowiae]
MKKYLILATALLFTFSAFTNFTDYGTNWELVKHILSMDTTLRSPEVIWCAITNYESATENYSVSFSHYGRDDQR